MYSVLTFLSVFSMIMKSHFVASAIYQFYTSEKKDPYFAALLLLNSSF